MNTLLLTTTEGAITADALREMDSSHLSHWNVEPIPSGLVGETGSTPEVAVVEVGDDANPAQLKELIPRLAHLQPGAPNGAFVLFALKRKARQALQETYFKQPRMEALLDEINASLAMFPHPERVDVVEYAPALLTKLRLIEAKLKIMPPRPTPLNQVKEAIEATGDLRVASGKLSAEAVARVFGITIGRLAGWLGRSRQAVNKTPDADSLQNELAFFERVARLRTLIPGEGFAKWLRMPNPQLDGRQPLAILAKGKGQIVADLVDDLLTGSPA